MILAQHPNFTVCYSNYLVICCKNFHCRPLVDTAVSSPTKAQPVEGACQRHRIGGRAAQPGAHRDLGGDDKVEAESG